MRCFITGVAGFIGLNLANRLIADGHSVTGFDNFSTGKESNLSSLRKLKNFHFIKGDLMSADFLAEHIAGHEIVFHFAANADIRNGLTRPRHDIEQNTVATHNLLEAMRQCGVKRLAFASSSAVYGDAAITPTPENCPFPVQISLYGASKMACEGLISAYCHGYGLSAVIFRFVSVLGNAYAHGHVIDFWRKLRQNHSILEILGDGHQKKSYIDVADCIDGIMLAVERHSHGVGFYNLGTEEVCEVRQSAKWICEAMDVKPEFRYAGGERGWPGDSPLVHLDIKKIKRLGFLPKKTIRQAIIGTIEYLERSKCDEYEFISKSNKK
jgi:UDP-glucose 4-epimerase